jgi:uncharacterized protein YwqG
MESVIRLPFELEPYRAQLLERERSCIQLLPQAGEPVLPWGSQIGGLPYLPAGFDIPLATDGRPLALLVQINFAESPPLPPFPEDGVLQIFIHDDGFYGLNLEDPFDQSNFRVRYLPTPEEAADAQLPSYDYRDELDTSSLPFNPWQAFALKLELAHELPLPQSLAFEQAMGADFFGQFGERKWELLDRYSQSLKPHLHKLGGYAQFTQEDPRSADSQMELLLQVGSDHAIESLWGDMGIANFFICPVDLERRDFSRVMYHWDCY